MRSSPRLRSLAMMTLMAGLIGGAGLARAQALKIDGLRLDQPLVERAVQPQMDGQMLTLPFSDGETVRVHPWSADLPQQLAAQRASSEILLKPAGPLARLALTRADETQPWLVMAHGTRPNGTLMGGWRLALVQQRWFAVQGERRVPLQATLRAGPARLTIEGATWCFHLQDARMPPAGSQARDQEPQLDWVMLRLDSCQHSCIGKPSNRSPAHK